MTATERKFIEKCFHDNVPMNDIKLAIVLSRAADAKVADRALETLEIIQQAKEDIDEVFREL